MDLPGDAEISRQRVALLGYGVENRALGQYLRERGISFAICDADANIVADPAVSDEWRLGEGWLEDLGDFNLVFRSPGVPTLRSELQHARARGVTVSSQTQLFLQRVPCPVVGVTGTKGKGTTVSLLAKMFADRPDTHVGGNIGTPPVQFLAELNADSLVVLELSSFQLQDMRRSPSTAVLLPVAADHLDYHADRSEYVEAKASICGFQHPEDIVLYAASDATADELSRRGRGQRRAVRVDGREVASGAWISDGGTVRWRQGGSESKLFHRDDVHVPGEHNLLNAALAAATAASLGVEADAIAAGTRAFLGLSHRLEHVARHNGVDYVNDSLATTPEAAAAGVVALDQPLAVIAGGASKGADFQVLGEAVVKTGVRCLVLMGEEAPRIAAAASSAGLPSSRIAEVGTMAEAVREATERVSSGDAVLLSPACSSFDMFGSYSERGDAFRAAVAAL
ncbi:MAG: UDP-N-acetylmuramoyl-L-alanine--D-glutamate ligase [Candidatus Latescibacterota bacterium]|nr:UDP-N-acetylmuramoyl-L-alanine--D-glutamate ligase [Candidatus Latescibacterota bacterium]